MKLIGADFIIFRCNRCGYEMRLRFPEYTDSWDGGDRLQACIVGWNRMINTRPCPRFPLASRQRCRVCGCDDLHACHTANGSCQWVEPDLCSACATRQQMNDALNAFHDAGKSVLSFMTALAGGWRILFDGLAGCARRK
ncbi:hypothetical protein OZX67_03930 [Bifidobacterium sp. ESL0728]|uniref:hypothetical protein n=1 Tax=Bifidobacterium sp. ESL0728 TaxID=2983220 RepID=UPI0023FA0CB2|nr:hypothetical protein [Bifidobacterium sp. ESL0728]WEV59697.1 hypothetical protein OZX67_03930 [Bifidobacterium sp. ESL0728]